MSVLNPCMTCGACCAYFRVSFYWAEGDDASGRVPASLTEPVTPFLRCMAGTNQKQPHCKALIGTPGENVSCAIYENRPSTCRELRRVIAPARDTDYHRFTKICFSIPLLMLPL